MPLDWFSLPTERSSKIPTQAVDTQGTFLVEVPEYRRPVLESAFSRQHPLRYWALHLLNS
jgi:hypothetical protein